MTVTEMVAVSVNSLLPLITWSLHGEAVHDRVRGLRLLSGLAQNLGAGTQNRPQTWPPK